VTINQKEKEFSTSDFTDSNIEIDILIQTSNTQKLIKILNN